MPARVSRRTRHGYRAAMVAMKRILSVVLLAWAAATAAWLLRRRADHAALEWVESHLHAPGTTAPQER